MIFKLGSKVRILFTLQSHCGAPSSWRAFEIIIITCYYGLELIQMSKFSASGKEIHIYLI